LSSSSSMRTSFFSIISSFSLRGIFCDGPKSLTRNDSLGDVTFGGQKVFWIVNGSAHVGTRLNKKSHPRLMKQSQRQRCVVFAISHQEDAKAWSKNKTRGWLRFPKEERTTEPDETNTKLERWPRTNLLRM
jgi:hypothetical protein